MRNVNFHVINVFQKKKNIYNTIAITKKKLQGVECNYF
jgi:hypothetical protein